MDERIKKFFDEENIEYYGAVDVESLKVINSGLLERSEISPKSTILFLIPYYVGDAENLSEYSAARDYHIVIRDITDRLARLLLEIYPENKFVGFGDHSPIDERYAALRAGLGILGDNGLLINEKYGTYVFLGDVITDVSPEVLGVGKPSPVLKCEGCGACKAACPTGILGGSALSCLSEITQRKGELSDQELELMVKVGTVWGCDVCQSVCPHNKNVSKTPIRFFLEERIPNLTSSLVSKMTKEEFRTRAFAWRGKKTVMRNLEYFENTKKSK